MELVEYAKKFIGLPYIWGANGGGAFDCSGFIQELLAFSGIDPKGDQTANDLYKTLLLSGNFKEILMSGIQFYEHDLIFYGRDSITHVAMALNSEQLIEAGGGNSLCKTVKDARMRQAHVRVRPIDHRKDFYAILRFVNNP